tara:strand:- start:573 stop:785 length:213 start_codon:yes stop_codon:yes gene_type:complete
MTMFKTGDIIQTIPGNGFNMYDPCRFKRPKDPVRGIITSIIGADIWCRLEGDYGNDGNQAKLTANGIKKI